MLEGSSRKIIDRFDRKPTLYVDFRGLGGQRDIKVREQAERSGATLRFPAQYNGMYSADVYVHPGVADRIRDFLGLAAFAIAQQGEVLGLSDLFDICVSGEGVEWPDTGRRGEEYS